MILKCWANTKRATIILAHKPLLRPLNIISTGPLAPELFSQICALKYNRKFKKKNLKKTSLGHSNLISSSMEIPPPSLQYSENNICKFPPANQVKSEFCDKYNVSPTPNIPRHVFR